MSKGNTECLKVLKDKPIESKCRKSFWKCLNQNYPSNITLVKVLNYSKVNTLHQVFKKNLEKQHFQIPRDFLIVWGMNSGSLFEQLNGFFHKSKMQSLFRTRQSAFFHHYNLSSSCSADKAIKSSRIDFWNLISDTFLMALSLNTLAGWEQVSKFIGLVSLLRWTFVCSCCKANPSRFLP